MSVLKIKKDAQEEFKIIKKNVKSEALKEIVKDLEQAIFGDDDDKDKEELKEAEELDRRFKNLISKKCCESLREYLKESEDANPQDRVNALRKKLTYLKQVIKQVIKQVMIITIIMIMMIVKIIKLAIL